MSCTEYNYNLLVLYYTSSYLECIDNPLDIWQSSSLFISIIIYVVVYKSFDSTISL